MNSQAEALSARSSESGSAVKRPQLAVLRAMLSACTERISVVGRDLRFIGASPAVFDAWNVGEADLFRSSLPQLIGKTYFHNQVNPYFQRVLAGESCKFELLLPNGDSGGARQMYEYNLSPYRGADSAIEGVVFRVLDLTELRRVENALSTTRQRLVDFADATSDWYWEMDDQLRFSWVSTQISSFYDMNPADMCGRKRNPLLQSRAERLSWDQHCRLLDAHQPFRDFEYRVQTGVGVRWARTSGVPVFDHSGTFVGYRGTASDITRLKEAESEAGQAEARFLHAIDEFPGSFALFDEKDRLVVFNQCYRQIHALLGGEIKPGLTFERCLRLQLEMGHIPSAVGREEQWLRERLNQFHKPQGAFEVKTSGGKWYRVTEQRLPDGGCLKTMLDITDQKNTEHTIKEERNLLRSLIDGIPHFIFAKNRQLEYTVFNKAAAEFLGRPTTTIEAGQRELDANFFPQEMCEKNTFQENRVINHAEKVENTQRLVNRPADGEAVWISTIKFPLCDTNGDVIGLVGASSDISAHKRVEMELLTSEQRFRDFAETAADWFWEMNADREFCYLSERYDEITGARAEDVIGVDYSAIAEMLIDDDEAKHRFYRAIQQAEAFSELELMIPGEAGIPRYFLISGKPRHDEHGAFCGFRGAGRDITRFRQLECRLIHQASHDDLTELPNRREFMRNLETIVVSSMQGGAHAVLGYLDLDQFKVINDTAGHLAGDQLLIQVSRLLRSCLRKSDSLARLGGDEFGILFHATSVEEAEHVMGHVIEELDAFRFQWRDKVFGIGGSIGLVALNGSNHSSTELLSQADLACYSAKDAGRGRVSLYNAENDDLSNRRSQLLVASGITDAIESDRFILYAQPIVSSTGDEVPAHYEILVRMLDDDNELIYPGAFIPAAERFGLMDRIDRWVIARALKDMGRVFQCGCLCSITINLSGQSLSDSTLVDYVQQHLEFNNVSPSRVCFEITETAAISNFQLAQYFIETLKGIGCTFALDDFGSGFSSFEYLKHFKVDYLKIDGGFVRDIVDDPTDRVMVSSINQVGQLLGMKTIAEFVENDEILDVLTEMGVDYVQGYGVGRPVEFRAPL